MNGVGTRSASGLRPRVRLPGRVLVVDDESAVAELIEVVLLGAGHDVEAEIDPRVALRRVLDGERFDAIVLDVLMPHLTGLEVWERIALVDAAQAERVIFVTACPESGMTDSFLDHVGVACLEKPFEPGDLRELVGFVVENANAGDDRDAPAPVLRPALGRSH